MYRRLERGQGNVLAYEIGASVTEEEAREILGQLREAIGEHGRIRLLVRMEGWPENATAAFTERLRFAKDHLGDIDRYAVVGDHQLLESLTEAADKVVGMELRHFDPAEEEAAWAWVGES
ncbi:STAS/SEC14 domain-containing protein [Nocardiopsis exhalans]|uniref:STAS/SEC14 domain-containing protein n=1 Tax=Nocardiopsis exhalans TaxID=163604 RepID=A0ABY5D5X5_9ACTN|nr:STAS/SEC14 domain-containing protein [Nocardiopsis exhalans]USY19365.1 STAS/SEC14 domain-containing protein [Nocardiopsis exhalans]